MSDWRYAPRVSKTKYERDAWDGRFFRKVREKRELSRESVAAATGISVNTLRLYEDNSHYPPHDWRDKAAVAVRIRRRSLGEPGDQR